MGGRCGQGMFRRLSTMTVLSFLCLSTECFTNSVIELDVLCSTSDWLLNLLLVLLGWSIQVPKKAHRTVNAHSTLSCCRLAWLMNEPEPSALAFHLFHQCGKWLHSCPDCTLNIWYALTSHTMQLSKYTFLYTYKLTEKWILIGYSYLKIIPLCFKNAFPQSKRHIFAILDLENLVAILFFDRNQYGFF